MAAPALSPRPPRRPCPAAATLAGLLAACLLLAVMIRPAGAAPALVAFDEANPPFMYSRDGVAEGIYPRLVGEAFRRMGIPVRLEADPWKRCLVMLDRGLAMVGGLYRTEERARKFDYSSPLFREELVLFVPAGKGFRFDSLADLTGKRIGLIRGWSYGDAFDRARRAGAFATDEAAGDQQTMEMLEGGRVDAVVAIRQSGETWIRRLGLTGRIRMLARPLATNDTYLAVNKSQAGNGLLTAFDGAIASMRQDGSYARLVARAFGGR